VNASRISSLGLGAVVISLLLFAGCGGVEKTDAADEEAPQAACTGPALSTANLPSKFPTFDSATYTRQARQGPTILVEGYYDGDVKEAHDEVKAALDDAGFVILFDELEEHDSEVSWKGQGRSGQVGMRDECGDPDKTYIRISNRPA
jgi:hypothetical protein